MAPLLTYLRLERSCLVMAGLLTSEVNMEVAPYITVALSLSTVARRSSASKRGVMTTLAPLYIAELRQVQPPQLW